jgi:hypothetical protein
MDPESAALYLKKSNLKSLIEWLTAEVLLNRPEDPLQFSRDLLGQKIVERGKGDYQPEQTTQYLSESYANATALVDEHGVIRNTEEFSKGQDSTSELLAASKIKLLGMNQLLEASTALTSLDSHVIAQSILHEIIRILHCDRSCVYICDNISNEILVHSSYLQVFH